MKLFKIIFRSNLWRSGSSEDGSQGRRTDTDSWQSDGPGRRDFWNIHVHWNSHQMLNNAQINAKNSYSTTISAVPLNHLQYMALKLHQLNLEAKNWILYSASMKLSFFGNC